MSTLWNRGMEMSSNYLVDMTRYFLDFEPPSDRSDNYSKIVTALIVLGFLERTAVATLNYECILDHAAARSGLRLAYLGGEPPPGHLLIFKPHGACNLLARGFEMYNVSIVLASGGDTGYFAGGIEGVDPAYAKAKYLAGYSMPAAMSLYAPGKHTPVAGRFVAEMRQRWNEWVQTCALLIVVGARPVISDQHIWQGIIGAGCDVWFAGAKDGGYRWLELAIGARLRYLAPTFDEAVDDIIVGLRQYADYAWFARGRRRWLQLP